MHLLALALASSSASFAKVSARGGVSIEEQERRKEYDPFAKTSDPFAAAALFQRKQTYDPWTVDKKASAGNSRLWTAAYDPFASGARADSPWYTAAYDPFASGTKAKQKELEAQFPRKYVSFMQGVNFALPDDAASDPFAAGAAEAQRAKAQLLSMANPKHRHHEQDHAHGKQHNKPLTVAEKRRLKG